MRNIVRMKTCFDDVVKLMGEIPLFENCSIRSRAELQTLLRIRARRFGVDEMVINETNTARSFFAVCSGCLHVYECGLADDTRHLVQRLTAGDIFGAGFPVMNLVRYPAMILAEEDGTLLEIDISATRELLASGRHLDFIRNLYAATARQGFFAWRKLMLLSCHEIADRVLLYIRWRREDGHSGPVAIRYPELAAYLGVNRTALYRAVAKLKKENKIRQIGQRIVAC